MEAQPNAQEPPFRYSAFYNDVAKFPNVATFRRLSVEWQWLLYNDLAEIDQKKDDCEAIYAEILGFPNGDKRFPITDYHQAHEQPENAILKIKIKSYKKSLRRYFRDLIRAARVANLPEQHKVFAKRFESHGLLFAGGKFGPTGESDTFYRGNKTSLDRCALRDLDRRDDSLTMLFVNNVNSFVTFWAERIRKKKKPTDSETPSPNDIDNITVEKFATLVDWLACLYVPLWLTGSMAILYCIRPLKYRIMALFLLGIVFALSIKMMGGHFNRIEIFAITVAYYAVVGVFFAATSGSPPSL